MPPGLSNGSKCQCRIILGMVVGWWGRREPRSSSQAKVCRVTKAILLPKLKKATFKITHKEREPGFRVTYYSRENFCDCWLSSRVGGEWQGWRSTLQGNFSKCINRKSSYFHLNKQICRRSKLLCFEMHLTTETETFSHTLSPANKAHLKFNAANKHWLTLVKVACYHNYFCQKTLGRKELRGVPAPQFSWYQ